MNEIKEKVRQYQNERMKTHGEAYQQMLVKRREWYALNSEQIKENHKQRYHERHDSDIKKSQAENQSHVHLLRNQTIQLLLVRLTAIIEPK